MQISRDGSMKKINGINVTPDTTIDPEKEVQLQKVKAEMKAGQILMEGAAKQIEKIKEQLEQRAGKRRARYRQHFRKTKMVQNRPDILRRSGFFLAFGNGGRVMGSLCKMESYHERLLFQSASKSVRYVPGAFGSCVKIHHGRRTDSPDGSLKCCII